MEKGLNTELYWKNDDPTHTVSMVPTSAITGEGIPDLLLWLVRLTQVRRLCVCCVEIYHWFDLSSRKTLCTEAVAYVNTTGFKTAVQVVVVLPLLELLFPFVLPSSLAAFGVVRWLVHLCAVPCTTDTR